MTKWLSHRMVERGIIKEEEQELYQFGIRNGMILLLNVVTALVIGLLTEQLAVVAVFTLSFMVLRSYTGGYHSDSRVFCYLGSNLVLLVPVYTQAVFYKNRWHGCWQYCWCPQGSFFYSVPCTARTGSWIKRNKSILAEKQG